MGSEAVGADEGNAIRIIAATDLWLAMTVAAVLTGAAVWTARRTSPRPFAVFIVLAAVAAAYASLGLETGFGSGFWAYVSEVVIAAYCAAAAGLTVAGLGFGLFGRRSPTGGDVTSALRARDLGQGSSTRSIGLFRVAAVSNLPGLGQIAESTHAPFYKSFLTLELAEASKEYGCPGLKLDLIAYGVKDERTREAAPDLHPAMSGSADRGSYEIDRVSIIIPDAPEGVPENAAVEEPGLATLSQPGP